MHESDERPSCDGVDRSRDALHQRHSNSILLAHVVWATRDRQSLLASNADAWFAGFFRSKAEELGARVMASGNAEDHVHLVLHYPATRSLVEMVHRLKGASSREWNLQLGSTRLAWQVGYWAESVSPRALAPLVSYVNGQREHHRAGSISPNWEPSPSPRRRTPAPTFAG